jgi:hypothetical protein
MTFRGLRNQAVFWAVAILLARYLHQAQDLGWLAAGALAAVAALVAVVLVALVTDRFLD